MNYSISKVKASPRRGLFCNLNESVAGVVAAKDLHREAPAVEVGEALCEPALSELDGAAFLASHRVTKLVENLNNHHDSTFLSEEGSIPS